MNTMPFSLLFFPSTCFFFPTCTRKLCVSVHPSWTGTGWFDLVSIGQVRVCGLRVGGKESRWVQCMVSAKSPTDPQQINCHVVTWRRGGGKKVCSSIHSISSPPVFPSHVPIHRLFLPSSTTTLVARCTTRQVHYSICA